MTRIDSLILAVGLAAVCSSPAIAVLGESEGAAIRRSVDWERKYGAVAPIVNIDSSGTVNRECWSAPPEGWDQKTALSFGVDLLPVDARSLVPERVSSDHCNNAFQVSGGYEICLIGFGESFFDIEVRASSYSGPVC